MHVAIWEEQTSHHTLCLCCLSLNFWGLVINCCLVKRRFTTPPLDRHIVNCASVGSFITASPLVYLISLTNAKFMDKLKVLLQLCRQSLGFFIRAEGMGNFGSSFLYFSMFKLWILLWVQTYRGSGIVRNAVQPIWSRFPKDGEHESRLLHPIGTSVNTFQVSITSCVFHVFYNGNSRGPN